MFEVKVIDSFSAAHNVRGYRGNCENLHGHNYKVEITAASRTLDKLGMAADFKLLREKLEKVLSHFDHKYLNELPPFTRVNPTAENIAKEIFVRLRRGFKPLRLARVTVYESESACATYSEGK